MIFSDFLFVVYICIPYFAIILLFRRNIFGKNIVLPAVIALSLIYYFFGPSSNIAMLACLLVANIPFVLMKLSGRVLTAAAIANIIFLFVVKGVFPDGAPLAISFVTFQLVGLLITRVRKPEIIPRVTDYFFFLTFFPQLVAGPIVQWNDVRSFLSRLHKNALYFRTLDWVLLFIAVGLAKKVLIADRLYEPVSLLQSGAAEFGFIDAVVFPVLYGLYLYFDFSSYSDIAVGLALLIGLRLPINFYSPYKAIDPITFWRCWHRTLYRFFRDYLHYLYRYCRLPRGIAYVGFIFVFSAYWHGAAWTYLIWGVGHAMWFLLYPRQFMARVPKVFRWAINLFIIMLLWVPFALDGPELIKWAESLSNPASALHRTEAGFSSVFLNLYDLYVIAAALAIALFAPNAFQLARSKEWWWVKRILVIGFLFACWPYVVDPKAPAIPFAYFQF